MTATKRFFAALRMTTCLFLLSVNFSLALPVSQANPISNLKASDPHLRRAAIDQIVQERLPKGIKPLRRALQDPDVLVRESAAWALGEMRDAAGVQVLAKAYERERGLLVKGAILEALAKIRRPAAGETLETAFMEPSPLLCKAAALGLGLLGDWARAEILLKRVNDPSPRVREFVALALAPYREDEAREALKVLSQDPLVQVRTNAFFSLKLQNPEILVTAASEGLVSNDEIVRLISARALGLRGRGQQARLALETTREGDASSWARWEADAALAEIRSREKADAGRKKAQKNTGQNGKKHRRNVKKS